MATAKKAIGFSKMERHPLSDKYGPNMSEDELKGLGLDIKANGQHDDIIEFEGKVLAGWNRYMACLQQGVTPRLKSKDEKSAPVSVAFGTNFVRRRLSSVQKAFFGAQYCTDTGVKQTEVAKLVGCNINRLNMCCQLLRRDDKPAKKAIDTLRENSEVSSATFDEMMLTLGLREEPKPRDAPLRTGTHAEFDDDDTGLGDDDLTGGAIDSLLDDALGDEPETRKRKEIGEGSAPLPPVGSKSSSQTRPVESTPSRLAKMFRALDPLDQQSFVFFAWGKLQQALNATIKAGKIQYTVGVETPESAGTKGKGKPKPDKKSLADKMEEAANKGKLDPSLIARGKAPAETEAEGKNNVDDDLLAGKAVPVVSIDKKSAAPAKKSAAPAKKVGPPAKKSATPAKKVSPPAKKVAAKKAPSKKK